MFVNAASPVLVSLLKLQLMVTVLVYWYGTYRKDSIVILVLDGLNVLGLGSFTGNIQAGQAKDATFGFFIDEKAKEQQRKALQIIFGGKAGWIHC